MEIVFVVNNIVNSMFVLYVVPQNVTSGRCILKIVLLVLLVPLFCTGRYNFRNGGTHCDWPVDGIGHR